MMNAVDKYSTDNIADNEMIIAVDDVVKKDYDSAVVRIKKALARSRDLKAMVYSNIGSYRGWYGKGQISDGSGTASSRDQLYRYRTIYQCASSCRTKNAGGRAAKCALFVH